MSVGDVISVVLLVVGLVTVAGSCAGIAVMDDPLDRLHLVTPAAMIGAVAVSAAVVVRDGLSASGLAAILVAVIVAGTGPFTSHAIARSIMVRHAATADGFDAARDEAAAGAAPAGTQAPGPDEDTP
jgi:multisubunit Na+/H+ antiporter MnhG subunit